MDVSKLTGNIFTGSSDNNLHQWDSTTGAIFRTFSGHEAKVSCCVVSVSGKEE